MKTFSKLIVISLILIPKLLFAQIDDSGASFVFAKKLFGDKMYELAAEQFHQFAEQNPNNPKAAEALYFAGLGYFNINEFQKAQKELFYLIFKFPDAKDLDQAQFKIAECFQALGDLAAAANAYLQVRGFYPRSPLAEQALFLAARMFFDDKQNNRAIEILYEFMEVYPASRLGLDAQLLLTESFTGEENYKRAQIELDKLLATTEIGSTNAKALLMKAKLSYKSQHLQQAEDDFLMLINKYTINRYANDREINKILNEAYYNLGEILRLKGMYEKSNQCLYKISDYETDSKVLLIAGENHFSTADYSKAIDVFQKIISVLDSTLMIRAHLKTGDSYFALKDYHNAASAYQQALELCENNSDDSQSQMCGSIYYKISEAYLNLNQSSIAISNFKKYRNSIGEAKNIDAVDYRIAYLYETAAKDFERSIRSYFDFMDSYPKSKFIDEAQFGLAKSYELSGNYSQAIVEYQNLMSRYPASEHYSAAEKRITYIKNYYQVEGSALRNLTGVIQQLAESKSETSKLYLLGLTYFNDFKDYRASIDLFNKAKEDGNVPKDELIYHRGRAYQLLSEKAMADIQQSSDLDSGEYNFDILIEHYPESSWADDAAFQKIEIKKLRLDKNHPAYIPQLKEALTSFIYKYPTSPLLDKVNFDLGLLLLNNAIKSSVDSLDVYNSFQKIITNFPSSSLVSSAEYYQSLLFYMAKNFNLAEERFNSFITNYPNDRKSCEAYYNLAKLSELKGDYAAASQFAKQIIIKYFYCNYADSAKLTIGYNLTKQQKYAEALSHYMDIYDDLELNATDQGNNTLQGDRNIVEDVMFNIAIILKMIGQKNEAIQFFQNYMIKFPNSKYSDQVLFSLGELFTTSQKDEQLKAMDYLQQLENNHSSSDLFSKALIKLGDLSFSQENYELAKQYYSKALNAQLSDEERAYAFAQETICLYKSGQIAAADEKLKEYRKQFRDEKDKQAEIQLERGDYFLRDKNFEQAEKIFKEIRSDFKNTPEGIKAEYFLGKLYFTLNKNEEALNILTDLIKKYPENQILAEVYITLGNFYYLQAKQIENALLAYKNAIELKGVTEQNLKIGMHNLIKCYADLQLWERAIAISRSFLDKFPLSEDAFEKKIQIGYYYYRLNEYDYAIQLFKRILPEANIDNEPRIQFWIGECYFGKGLFQQAITEYLKIVYFSKPAKLLSQYKVTAQYQSAISYIKLKKLENAKQLFQRIITEQGAESVFGKPAKEKLEEIEQMIAEKKQGNL